MLKLILFLTLLNNPPSYKFLSWCDYICKPDTFLITQGIVAHTETQWIMKDSTDENGKVFWETKCIFIPEKSWTTTHSHLVLCHENTHYQISVLWHNKWVQILKKYQGCPEAKRQKVINLYNHYWKESQKLQELFDHETKHGIVESIEIQWEEQIKKDTLWN